MADFGDIAQDITEKHISLSLHNRKTLSIPFSGSCLSCGEPVSERRYCDSVCREDHELKMKSSAGASRTTI